jgi:diketogulonate reductase-like aldo/keto reductase
MATVTIRSLELPSGEVIPILGQGTWHLGEDPSRRDEEIEALRVGIDLGLTLIDTAEMYGNGATEVLVGDAIVGRRERVFLVSKVLPQHATVEGMFAACTASLTRLGTDWLDLYLLHWRGPVPLEETIEGFGALMGAGMINHWGVSNFDLSDLSELMRLPGGTAVETNQVLYNLARRGVEFDLLPASNAAGLPLMAYSPVDQGRLLDNPVLRRVAATHEATPAQVALAWVLRHDGVNAIPRSGAPEHVRENHAALDLELTDRDLALLDQAFPPPLGPQPLELL